MTTQACESCDHDHCVICGVTCGRSGLCDKHRYDDQPPEFCLICGREFQDDDRTWRTRKPWGLVHVGCGYVTADGLLFRDGHDAVRATLEALDGSTASAVSLLTGLSPERLEELGGFEVVTDD